jgi:hypothetical protein
MSTEPVLTFDVEGQPVVCYQTGEDRLWRCECAYFQRTLTTYKASARGVKANENPFGSQFTRYAASAPPVLRRSP